MGLPPGLGILLARQPQWGVGAFPVGPGSCGSYDLQLSCPQSRRGWPVSSQTMVAFSHLCKAW